MKKGILTALVVLVAVLFASAGATSVVGLASSIPVSSRALTAYRSCIISATPSASSAVSDSYVNQGSANTNSGTATFLDVTSASGANRRTYLKFDVTRCNPQIPATATMQTATLRLFATAVPATCRTQNIYRVAASWTETGVTWTNQPFGTAINNPPTAQRTSSITVGSAPCQNTAANSYVNGWDVTADVQAFVSGGATNQGWMIRDDTENSTTSRNVRYASKQAANTARAPQLIISWRMP
jgi:hypothetical protein